jgi:hypothetical protein
MEVNSVTWLMLVSSVNVGDKLVEIPKYRIPLRFIEIGEDAEELATGRISLMIPFIEQNLTDDSLHRNQ